MKEQSRQSLEVDRDELTTVVGGSHCLGPVLAQQDSLREGAMPIPVGT